MPICSNKQRSQQLRGAGERREVCARRRERANHCLSVGCSVSKKGRVERADGGSYAGAVRLPTTGDGNCLMAQYEWIKSHCPHARMADIDEASGEILGHRTEEREGRIYSVFPLRLEDGRLQRVYFDVTDCKK